MPNPDTTKRAPMRWRKRVMGRFARERAHELAQGENVIAVVQSIDGGRGGWFWYGLGLNTANAPASLAECKAGAMRAAIKAMSNNG